MKLCICKWVQRNKDALRLLLYEHTLGLGTETSLAH